MQLIIGNLMLYGVSRKTLLDYNHSSVQMSAAVCDIRLLPSVVLDPIKRMVKLKIICFERKRPLRSSLLHSRLCQAPPNLSLRAITAVSVRNGVESALGYLETFLTPNFSTLASPQSPTHVVRCDLGHADGSAGRMDPIDRRAIM